ncbi:M20 family metallopeptidase [Mycolicibacterium baixiangningiae]|uniref:M20 family metallopeptidase n=1 Tax=Mycolicibacterium baixiangningiae TaxID=2761578 RepID=UPI001D0303CD|nr:M20/M25/M40 family metallo-hydrolase [Mycolicibacterium baixiangningiae]
MSGLLTELVALQTISGDAAPQRQTIELCLSLLRARGAHTHVDADLDGPHPWAVLTNDAPPGAARLAFCCHVDTVPTGPLAAWSWPPFAAQVHDGRLIGRGATDMKGGLVAALSALEDALDTGVPVALVLTSDEEVGALGAQRARHAVLEAGVGAVIIPEATANGVRLGHRGALWLRINSAGVAAHGSTPHLGRNAILLLMDLVQRARAELPRTTDPHLGPSTWNLGTIAGGAAPNIVAAQASCVVDHRTVGNGGELLDWWRAQPEAHDVEALIDLPAMWTPADDAWVAQLPSAAGTEPVPYFTDGSAFSAVLPGVPIVVWGPGDPATMHAADESILLSNLDVAAHHYRRVVGRWGAVD